MSRVKSVALRPADSNEPLTEMATSNSNDISSPFLGKGILIMTSFDKSGFKSGIRQTSLRTVPLVSSDFRDSQAKSRRSAALHAAVHHWSKLCALRKCSWASSNFICSCLQRLFISNFFCIPDIVSLSLTEPTMLNIRRISISMQAKITMEFLSWVTIINIPSPVKSKVITYIVTTT